MHCSLLFLCLVREYHSARNNLNTDLATSFCNLTIPVYTVIRWGDMASTSSIAEANKITNTEFESLLSQYPDIIKTISESKGGKSYISCSLIQVANGEITAKDGQKTLQELDDYRYDEALSIFSIAKSQRSMDLDDVKVLVEWKL